MVSTVILVAFRFLVTIGYLIWWERFNPMGRETGEDYFWRIVFLSIFVIPQIFVFSCPTHLLFSDFIAG